MTFVTFIHGGLVNPQRNYHVYIQAQVFNVYLSSLVVEETCCLNLFLFCYSDYLLCQFSFCWKEEASHFKMLFASHLYYQSYLLLFNVPCMQFTPQNKSWLGSLINTIIGNLKLSISNIHIRYEDLERYIKWGNFLLLTVY